MTVPIQPIVDFLAHNQVEHSQINEQMVGFSMAMPKGHVLYDTLAQREINLPDKIDAVFCRYAETAEEPGLLILDCLAPISYADDTENALILYVNQLNERLVWPYLVVRCDEKMVSCRLNTYIVNVQDADQVIQEMIGALTGAILLFISSLHLVTHELSSVNTALESLHNLMADMEEAAQAEEADSLNGSSLN